MTDMFYDEISEYYDQMIPFEKRIQNLEKQLKGIVEKYQIKSALDAGSATGATCIALKHLGVIPVGIELSRKMVRIAKRHAEDMGMHIDLLQGDLLKARPAFRGKFDAVFIIANTISHFLDKRSLEKLLRNFRQWLRPRGTLVVQLLNYERIFKERERIVKIYNNNDRVFVRFYDFGRKTLNFNLLTIENRPGFSDYSLSSAPLRGWKSSEIKAALTKSGFVSTKMVGTFSGKKFDPRKSSDLVLTARRKP
jgi:glycine/sarcosine N-methyltransferase